MWMTSTLSLKDEKIVLLQPSHRIAVEALRAVTLLFNLYINCLGF